MNTISKYELELLSRALNFAQDAWLASKPDVDPFDFEGIYTVNATDAEREALDADLTVMLDTLSNKIEYIYDDMSRNDLLAIVK